VRIGIRHALVVLLAGGTLAAAGGPSGVAVRADGAWDAVRAEVDGDVPPPVAVPRDALRPDGRLDARGDRLVRLARDAIDGRCGQPGSAGLAVDGGTAAVDGAIATLAALYAAYPDATATAGALRATLQDAADDLRLGCRDEHRSQRLLRAIARGDRA